MQAFCAASGGGARCDERQHMCQQGVYQVIVSTVLRCISV